MVSQSSVQLDQTLKYCWHKEENGINYMLAVGQIKTEPVQGIVEITASTNRCRHCPLNLIHCETSCTQRLVHVLR